MKLMIFNLRNDFQFDEIPKNVYTIQWDGYVDEA